VLNWKVKICKEVGKTYVRWMDEDEDEDDDEDDCNRLGVEEE